MGPAKVDLGDPELTFDECNKASHALYQPGLLVEEILKQCSSLT